MRERPILFSAPMVRAILDGRKTQTRRIVKNADYYACISGDCPHETQSECDKSMPRFCPYGIPGDRLWVRECWTPDHRDFYPHFPAVYKADAAYNYDRNEKGEVYSPEQKSWYPYRWRPSIHMPRWASRITLEVVGVRVERVQDISEADAEAEGFERTFAADGSEYGAGLTTATEAFAALWSKITGPASWSENPWVWVVEFRRIEARQ